MNFRRLPAAALNTRSILRSGLPVFLAAILAACGGGGAGNGGGGSGGNGGGNGGGTPPDTTAPQTAIDTAPAATIYTNGTSLAFSANETGATFEGRLDAAAFAAVTSPVTLSALADGAHTYEVRARDAAGNTDATPAQAQFTVLAGPPNTTIDTSPGAATNASTASFTFSSSKPGSTFEVSVDGGAFATAQSPFDLTAVAVGSHIFAVRATDTTNQVDGSPAIHDWVVDVTAPAAKILFPTRLSYTDATSLTVRGTASDAHGIGSVRVNGVAATSIDGFANWRANVPLSAIDTPVIVSVTDVAGNTTASADAVNVKNRGPVLSDYVGLAWDPNGNQVVALDRSANAVYAYRATDGVGRLLSAGPSPGAQPGQSMPTVLAVDATRNRALFVDYIIDALVAVDLATGTRTIASPPQGQGSPTNLAVANDLALDPAGNRAFAANIICNCIIGMNLDNGTRSIVASATVGTGAYPSTGVIGLVYDDITTPNAPRLLTSSWTAPGVQELLAIDIATGNRTVVSSFSNLVGAGPDTGGTMSLMLDPLRHRLLTADNRVFGIMAIDLVTGDRSLIMGQHDGTGPLMYPTIGAAYDPVANRMFSKQVLEEDIIVTELATQTRTAFISAHVGSGPAPNIPYSLVIEQTTGPAESLLYTEVSPAALYRLDLATGVRTTVSDDTGTGFGPVLEGLADIVLDTRVTVGNPKVLALTGTPGFRLVSIDLVTGNRTQVADLNATGTAVIHPKHLELDAANNRTLFTDVDYSGDGDTLFAIDLDTGARNVISSSSVGGGLEIGQFSDFVLDTTVTPTRAILSDTTKQRYLAVDLGNGNRTLFAGGTFGTAEQQFNGPGTVILDAANSRLLAANGGSPSNLFSLSLQDKSQRLLSGRDLFTHELKGAGPEAYFGDIALDLERQLVYASGGAGGSLIAVDLVSGDRVIIAN